MIGLIWKDILVSQKTLKSYAIFLLAYLTLALLDVFDFTFVVSFSMVIFMVLPLSTFAYDEQAKWERYARTLPLSPQMLVGARYLFLLLLTTVIGLLNLAASLLLSHFHALNLLDVIPSILSAIGVGLLIVGCMIPLSYHFGVERARPFLYGIIFLPMIGLFLLAKLGLFSQLDLSFLDRLPPAGLLACFALIPLLGVLWLFLSFWISCRIAARTEV